MDKDEGNMQKNISKAKLLRPGEKTFTVVLLTLGVVLFACALRLWFESDEPRIASAAALPLLITCVWVLLAFIILIENIGKEAESKKNLAAAAFDIFPVNVIKVIAVVVMYCLLLFFGVGFYILTPLFLWGTMCMLGKGGYIKNLLWSAACMAFVYVVFTLMLNVVMP